MRFVVCVPWLIALPLYALAAMVWLAVELLAALAFVGTIAVMWLRNRRLYTR